MNNSKTALLLHGFTSTSNSYFLPKTREYLEDNGFEVCAPDLPNPDAPSLESWIAAVEPMLASVNHEFDTVVCHSLGGSLAFQLLSRHLLKAKKLFVIGSSYGPCANRDMNTFSSPAIDFNLVKEYTGSIYAVFSLDDPWTPSEYGLLTIKELGAIGLVFSNMGHFEVNELPKVVLDLL